MIEITTYQPATNLKEKEEKLKKNKLKEKRLPGGSMKKKLNAKQPKITYKTTSRIKKTFNVPDIDHDVLWDFHYKNPIPLITDY